MHEREEMNTERERERERIISKRHGYVERIDTYLNGIVELQRFTVVLCLEKAFKIHSSERILLV